MLANALRLSRSAHAARSATCRYAASPRRALSALSGGTQPQRQTLAGMGIKLIVCDMAGTTVEEHAVYKTLREAMMSHGLKASR